MSSYRRLPPELDGRFVAALARLPDKTFQQHSLGRPRGKSPWMALIASAIAHVVVLLAVSAGVVVTVEVAQVSVLVCEIAADPEEASLELLGATADPAIEVEPDLPEAGTPIAGAEAWKQLAVDEVEPIEFPLVDVPRPSLFDFPTDQLLLEVPAEDKSDVRRATSRDRRADQRDEPRPPAAEYFGTVARGDRFVYVLDRSGSMSGGRLERAAAELLRSLDQLQPDQSFYVVLFSDGMLRMFDDADEPPRMLPATPENRQRLRKWLGSINADGGTQPKDAIRFAISLRPSAVFLLSDGEFNGMTSRTDLFGADSPAGKILDGSQAVPIHSFAYEDPAARGNMQTLAALTGGQYRYIEPRPGPPDAGAMPAGAVPVANAIPNGGVPLPETAPVPLEALTPWQRADAMLKAAEQLDAVGNANEALQMYRNVVYQYPMTPAGAKARGRIVQLWNAIRMGRR
jgi:hypothetical protein